MGRRTRRKDLESYRVDEKTVEVLLKSPLVQANLRVMLAPFTEAWFIGSLGGAFFRVGELEEEVKKLLWSCPMCGKDRRKRDPNCCNSKCKGKWGTGCYCCHHQKYIKDAFEQMQEELIEFKNLWEERME